MTVGIGQDVAVAAVSAAAMLAGSATYIKARAATVNSTIDLLKENLVALEQRRKLDAEFHDAQVIALNEKLIHIQAESKVLQNAVVDRLVALVAEAIARQTRDVLVDIRNELRHIDAMTGLIRKAVGTRGRGDAQTEGDDDDE